MGTNAKGAGDAGEDPRDQSLIDSAIEYLEGERGPVSITGAASSLSVLGKHGGDAWPLATTGQWCEAIREAGAAGLLVIEGDRVRVPPVAGGAGLEESEITQGTLF